MISWTRLLTGESQDYDNLRYSNCNNHTPKIVVWNVTSCCNLSCLHCYFEAPRGLNSDELSKKEVENFIEDLSEINLPVLLFSGGEPLLRKDIFQLGRFAKDRGINVILSTNGTLITQEVAKKIKEAGFSYVGISLDGMREINDSFRQSKGAFKASLIGIRNCQKLGLKVGLRFTLTKYNFKDLSRIFDLVERECIPRICIYHLVYTGRGKRIRQDDISHQVRRRILELIWQKVLDFSGKRLKIEVLTVDNHADGIWIYLRLKNKNPEHAQRVFELLRAQGGNGSGIKIGAVDNLGNIHPDQFWRNHCLGNIRKKRFSEVWQDKDNAFLKSLRNRKTLLKGRCQRCNFLEICNGNFRARAEAVSGDMWQEDTGCYLTDEEIGAK